MFVFVSIHVCFFFYRNAGGNQSEIVVNNERLFGGSSFIETEIFSCFKYIT